MTGPYRSRDGERRVRDWCARRLDGWGVPHDRTSIETPLGSTHLVEAGTGDTLCVFLPGTNFNAATSLRLLEGLSPRVRVVAVDLPGQPGLSSSVRPRPEAEGYGAWLGDVLDVVRARHRPERLVVVAHSRGAAVALAGPTDVDALGLVSPAGLARVRTSGGVLRTALPWLLRPTAARSASLLRLMSGAPGDPDPALVEWMTLVARDTRSTGAPGPLPDHLLDRWRGTPVSVLAGEHDCFFPPERLRGPAAARLGATVQVLDGVGHLAVEEAPDLVAEHLGLLDG